MTVRRNPLRRLGALLLTLLLPAAITFGLLEVVCRILDPIGISYYPETAKWLDTMVVKDPIGYWNRPGYTGHHFGTLVRINSIGLRGPEVPPKAANEVRVLMMGDSFPFGMGVSEEHALPAVVESLLDAKASPGVDYRVLNMGVVSYNSEQELRQLQELGLGLKPDLVVLAFASNDIEPIMWVFDKRKGVVVDTIQRSYAGSLIAITLRNLKYKIFGYTGLDLGEYREDSPRWQAVDRSLSRMNALCRDAGVRFVVFLDDDKLADVPLVQGVGRRESFPVLNLAPLMRARLGSRNPRELSNSISDSHPNIEGNQVWGELLVGALRDAGVVPAGPRLDTVAPRP